jgi:hypothetical protein
VEVIALLGSSSEMSVRLLAFMIGVLAGLLYIPVYKYSRRPGKHRVLRNNCLGVGILMGCVMVPIWVLASISTGAEITYLLGFFLAGLLSPIAVFVIAGYRTSSTSRSNSILRSDSNVVPNRCRNQHPEIPRGLQEFAKTRVILLQSIFALALLAYILTRVHNGWDYLTSPVLGPIIGACFFAWYPLEFRRTVRIPGGEEKNLEGERLIDTLTSARRSSVAAQSAALTAIIALAFCQVVAFMIEAPVEWSFNLVQIVTSSLLFAVCSLPAHIHVILRRGTNGHRR